MAGAFVQVAGQGGSESTASSINVTLSGTTSGNLLVAVIATKFSSGAFSDPSGWTKVHDNTADAASGAMYYRVADGAETSVTFTWTDAREHAVTVCEYSGLDATAPFEAGGENNTYATTAQTGGASINTGSATPSTANGMAVAGFSGPDERDYGPTELTIDNSYTRDGYYTPAEGNNAVAAAAWKAYTSTAAQSPNWSPRTGVDWQGYGTIAVFKEPAAGGATPKGPLGHPFHGPFGGPL